MNYRIILAGLSGTVATAVVGVLHNWHDQTLTRRSAGDRTLLLQTHEDLLKQMDMLVIFVSGRPAHELEGEGEDNLIRHSQIRAGFMIMYAKQLVARILRQENSRGYCGELSEAQKVLDAVQDFIDRRDYRNAADLEARIENARDRLRCYRSWFASIHT